MGLYNEIAAVTIIRLFLGFLFFLQGYDKFFRVGMRNVITAFKEPLMAHRIPGFAIALAAWYTSLAELIGGLFLIIGFMKNIALYCLGIDLIMVCVAFGIIKPMWNMEHVFPRLVLLTAMLVMPDAWDVLTLEELIKYFR